METKKINYVWKDRKRYLGMPLSVTRYALSEDRLFLSQGLLSVKDDEILLYRVRDITTTRSLWQRLFGVGTVTVLSSDQTIPSLVMKNVKDPVAVKELLHEYVEEMKIRRRVRINEISGGEGHDCCHHGADSANDDADDADDFDDLN